MKAALALDLMKMGKSIHFIGEPGLSWYEVSLLVRGRWPEMHVCRERVEGIALMEPATRVALLTADAVRGANWQRARSDAPQPISAHFEIYPNLQESQPDAPRRNRPRTLADLQRIRERVEHMRANAVPA